MSTSNSLWSPNPLAVWRYAVALASVTAAAMLAMVLEIYWQSTPFVSLFLCAIIVSAWFGGLKPGLLAIALSVLAFDYYFLPPTHSLVPNLNELPRLVLFAIAALMVGLLSAAQRSTTESLRLARDELAAKVQELKNANEALHAENAERKLAEAALQKAQAELAHITRMTTMGELTASIAHEVNQPLTAVLNNANACLDLLDPAPKRLGEGGPKGASHLEEIRDALTEIIEDADRASAVIARVRQLARKAPFERTLLNLKEVITDVFALARYESASRRVTIRTELPEELPLVLGDRVQLQQVLLNLVVNGMDAMDTVEESKRVLMICGRRETRDGMPGVLLSVQDSGTGLKPEEMARLFEAFYTTKPHGMGIGLAISRSIIEAHGGRLWAEPNLGPGATFLFSLPAAPECPGEGEPDAGTAAS
jgi:C4-dicarboxylate-specific signal transduction histidine kinase